MCWRDDVRTTRTCSSCGQSYYGDLGHRNCPKRIKETEETTSASAEQEEK